MLKIYYKFQEQSENLLVNRLFKNGVHEHKATIKEHYHQYKNVLADIKGKDVNNSAVFEHLKDNKLNISPEESAYRSMVEGDGVFTRIITNTINKIEFRRVYKESTIFVKKHPYIILAPIGGLAGIGLYLNKEQLELIPFFEKSKKNILKYFIKSHDETIKDILKYKPDNSFFENFCTVLGSVAFGSVQIGKSIKDGLWAGFIYSMPDAFKEAYKNIK